MDFLYINYLLIFPICNKKLLYKNLPSHRLYFSFIIIIALSILILELNVTGDYIIKLAIIIIRICNWIANIINDAILKFIRIGCSLASII